MPRPHRLLRRLLRIKDRGTFLTLCATIIGFAAAVAVAGYRIQKNEENDAAREIRTEAAIEKIRAEAKIDHDLLIRIDANVEMIAKQLDARP